MIGITQSKALSTIRKCSGEVVLTVVPGYVLRQEGERWRVIERERERERREIERDMESERGGDMESDGERGDIDSEREGR